MVGRFAGQHALGFDNYRRLFADPHFARTAKLSGRLRSALRTLTFTGSSLFESVSLIVQWVGDLCRPGSDFSFIKMSKNCHVRVTCGVHLLAGAGGIPNRKAKAGASNATTGTHRAGLGTRRGSIMPSLVTDGACAAANSDVLTLRPDSGGQ